MVYGTRQAFNTDAIRGVNIDNMGDDKFIVCWTDDAGTVENPECKVGTVSGTTITYGAEAVIDTVDVNFDFDVCSLDANTAVVTYIDSSGDDVWARLATTTGTTINLGIASQTIDTTTAGVIACWVGDVIGAFGTQPASSVGISSSTINKRCFIVTAIILLVGKTKKLSISLSLVRIQW